MANSEQPEARPKCGYTIKTPVPPNTPAVPDRKCDSEQGLKEVAGHSKFYGNPMKTPVCDKHLTDAIRDWHWESIGNLPRGLK